MKKVVLLFFVLATALSYSLPGYSQACGVSNVGIQLVSQTNNGSGGCTVVFNLSWDQTGNNGNKWTFVHLWQASQYPALSYSHVPNSTDLAATLGTLVLKDGVLQTGSTAYPNGTVTILSASSGGKTLNPNGSTHYQFNNVTISFASCPPSIAIAADVWSTNAANANASQCIEKDVEFSLSDPNIIGTYFCTSLDPAAARQYALTMNPTATYTASYSIYVDDGDGVYETNGSDVMAKTVSSFTLSGSYTSGRQSLPAPFSAWTPYVNNGYFFVVTLTDANLNTFNRIVLIENGCSPIKSLPVSFKSFAVARNKQKVEVKWETASEQDNVGFYVQRNTDGTWKNVAFVFSQADGGNSSQALSYKFNDVNNTTGVSQYRIQQVDIDGKARYSNVRYLKGEQQTSNLLIFPNPSADGKFNLMFGDANSLKDVIINDSNGRTIKTYKNVSDASLLIENLKNGLYIIQVKDLSTLKLSVEKIIVTRQ